uniref:NADH-ubiquinone oxidoreductase chain 5 n=1 Tax=Limnodrilus hoffmeisteri TaxID=76587 RepID=A0A8F2FAN8_9ANNE|nr:NADH dehydrogenase subunit 5 [Limnodrilus hoffmeisteri]
MLIFLSVFMWASGLFLLSKNLSILVEWTMLNLLLTPMKFMLICDPVGVIYGATVLFIAANVMMFSKFYMSNDPFINRFSVLVMLFVTSMMALIFIPNLMALLLGWDGLGITSFILVIYYQNPKSLGAGMITAMMNRIGDVMILIAIALTLNQGHWTITNMWPTPTLGFQALMIMVAGCTKSAQMPFSSWLPAAMAAPTPVSALVHSSTLVTAGVFLLIRFYPFLHLWTHFNNILLFISVLTMFMAGISATTECDMKKIIALSTLSQLGVMMCSIGLNSPTMATFHMITHALFKALLFICAGQLIANHMHGQDLRWMGNLASQNPMTSSSILVANMALCGLPFLAGFYSKDLIMEYMLTSGFNTLMIAMSFMAIGFTTFYSIRFSLLVIWSPLNHLPLFNPTETYSTMIPMSMMSFMSIIIGSLMLWIMPIQTIPLLMPLSSKIMTISMIMVGMLISWYLTLKKVVSDALLLKMHLTNYASCMMWFLVVLSTQPIINSSLKTSHHNLLKHSDQGWFEQLTAQGLFSKMISSIGMLIQKTNLYTPTSLITSSAIGRLTYTTTPNLFNSMAKVAYMKH